MMTAAGIQPFQFGIDADDPASVDAFERAVDGADEATALALLDAMESAESFFAYVEKDDARRLESEYPKAFGLAQRLNPFDGTSNAYLEQIRGHHQLAGRMAGIRKKLEHRIMSSERQNAESLYRELRRKVGGTDESVAALAAAALVSGKTSTAAAATYQSIRDAIGGSPDAAISVASGALLGNKQPAEAVALYKELSRTIAAKDQDLATLTATTLLTGKTACEAKVVYDAVRERWASSREPIGTLAAIALSGEYTPAQVDAWHEAVRSRQSIKRTTSDLALNHYKVGSRDFQSSKSAHGAPEARLLLQGPSHAQSVQDRAKRVEAEGVYAVYSAVRDDRVGSDIVAARLATAATFRSMKTPTAALPSSILFVTLIAPLRESATPVQPGTATAPSGCTQAEVVKGLEERSMERHTSYIVPRSTLEGVASPDTY